MIDLTKFEIPKLIPDKSLELIYQERRQRFLALEPNYTLADMDPINKALRAAALDEYQVRRHVNDMALKAIWATSSGLALEGLALNFKNLRRLPGESDDDFKQRGVEVGGGFSVGGSVSAYDFIGRRGLEAEVDQFYTYSVRRNSSEINGVILFKNHLDTIAAPGDSDAGRRRETVIDQVKLNLAPDDARPLNDIVTVKVAEPVRWNLSVTLVTPKGVDPLIIKSEAEKNVRAYDATTKKVGLDVSYLELLKAILLPGVTGLEGLNIKSDIPVSRDEAPFLEELSITVSDRIDVRR